MFEETTLSLNDLVLPIFVEEEIDDYKAVEAMPGVMRIPEKHLAREIERIANAGIRSVMTFGISHHTDETGSDAWREDGLVARMSRICKQTVPEMIVMSDTCSVNTLLTVTAVCCASMASTTTRLWKI
ncbi:delta-aminolevulinic acid dehydratase [Escherichia coli]|uniref:Delta-aminolevulinic acid dehydratase n=1 Tax=Escherichia coli TaxID=562 RepID=A0A376MS45_ECOLX|nr:delta-aminolevulinic acid dehydratase [Escherichia coli]